MPHRPLLLSLIRLSLMVLLLGGRFAGAQETSLKPIKLTDGVRLLLKPEPTSEVVAVAAFVRTPPDRTAQDAAIGEVVARAFLYGSVHRSFDLIAAAVAQTGGKIEILRQPDYVAVVYQVVPEQLGEAIYMICESLKNAEFRPEALERARKQILAERQPRQADVFLAVQNALSEAFRPFPEPTEAMLRRVTTEQAKAYFEKRFVPSQTVISVVGRFNASQVPRSFDNNLFDYTRTSPLPATPPPTIPPSNLTPSSAVTLRPDASLSAPSLVFNGNAAYAFVATSAPTVGSPDYPAFTVLQALLGGGHASRLFRRIREAQGIGYSVGATYAPERSEPLIAYLQWDARRPLTAEETGAKKITSPSPEELLALQLDSVLKEIPDDAELNRARKVAIGRDALRHERARDRAFLPGWYEAVGLGCGFDAELPRLLANVSREDLLRVARLYLASRLSATALPPARKSTP